jgi:hypothetical protein
MKKFFRTLGLGAFALSVTASNSFAAGLGLTSTDVSLDTSDAKIVAIAVIGVLGAIWCFRRALAFLSR